MVRGRERKGGGSERPHRFFLCQRGSSHEKRRPGWGCKGGAGVEAKQSGGGLRPVLGTPRIASLDKRLVRRWLETNERKWPVASLGP